MYQAHLVGPNFSGRGVRFRVLSGTEYTNVALDAGKLVGADGTVLELTKAEGLLGVKRMLLGVTKKDALKDLGGAEWMPLSEKILDEKFDEYFTPKDSNMLVALYRRYHQISEQELDDIAGKVCQVASGD